MGRLALALSLSIGLPAIAAATCGGTKLAVVKKVVRAVLACHPGGCGKQHGR
jgi:hypothetical protein